MKCKDCPAGKKITRRSHGCVECIPYGMILLEDHECEREGWKDYVVDDRRVPGGEDGRTDNGGADQWDGGQDERMEEEEA